MKQEQLKRRLAAARGETPADNTLLTSSGEWKLP